MSEMSERTGLLVGEEGIRRLSEASVILAGVGAVGGYALEGYEDLPRLTEKLLGRGMGPGTVQKLLGGNLLRFYRQILG